MRRRLVLAIASVALLAVVLFAVPLALVLQRTYRDEELLRLQRDTVAATREIDVTQGEPDSVELPPGADGFAVYDARGRRVAGTTGPAVADDVVREALSRQSPTTLVRGGQLLVAVPLVADEQVTGAVRAVRDDAAVTRATRGRWLLLLGVALAVVLLAILAAVILGRRLAAPLERLAGVARRLGDGDFAVRAPRAGVREVDDVAAALQTAGARLDDLVSRERAFSADASHQLRTPLAALRIELEALELRGQTSAELTAALGEVDRLQDTIDTLLRAARDAPVTQARTALTGFLDDVVARWRPRTDAVGRRLELRVEDDGLIAQISAPVLREIFDVLLDNALEHGRGAVTVRVREAPGSVAIDVSDEGSAALDEQAIFERRSASARGHGIGLALARSLAHAEGGRLMLSQAAPPVFTLLLRDTGDGVTAAARSGGQACA